MKSKTIDDTEGFFLALADKTRLRLLNLMREREVNVNSFVEITGESQPKISRHLAFLRNAGIVELRREGKWIYYKIAQPKNDFAALILHDALDWLNSQDELRLENEKFVKARGLPEETKAEETFFQSNKFAQTDMKEIKRQELEIHLL